LTLKEAQDLPWPFRWRGKKFIGSSRFGEHRWVRLALGSVNTKQQTRYQRFATISRQNGCFACQ